MSRVSRVPRTTPSPLVMWGALLVVYIVWGSTYLAIRLVVESMPPFLAAGARFVVAGLILGLALVVTGRGLGRLRVSRDQLAGSAIVGGLLLFIGNGGVSLGEQTVPSGLAALIVGIIPLVVLVLRRVAGERVSSTGIGGVVLGFVGLGVLVVPRGIDGSADVLGMALLIGASIAWATGSFLSKRLRVPPDALVATFWQLIAGGLMLLVSGLLLGEWSQVEAGGFTEASVWSLAYLVVFGSLLAYTAYTWLLQHAPIGRVATYAYVNPVVAVALGALILRETIDPLMLVGAAMIIASVAFIIATESRPVLRDVATAAPHPAPWSPRGMWRRLRRQTTA